MIENAITDSRNRILCIHVKSSKEQFLGRVMVLNDEWMRLHGWMVKEKAQAPQNGYTNHENTSEIQTTVDPQAEYNPVSELSTSIISHVHINDTSPVPLANKSKGGRPKGSKNKRKRISVKQ